MESHLGGPAPLLCPIPELGSPSPGVVSLAGGSKTSDMLSRVGQCKGRGDRKKGGENQQKMGIVSRDS